MLFPLTQKFRINLHTIESNCHLKYHDMKIENKISLVVQILCRLVSASLKKAIPPRCAWVLSNASEHATIMLGELLPSVQILSVKPTYFSDWLCCHQSFRTFHMRSQMCKINFLSSHCLGDSSLSEMYPNNSPQQKTCVQSLAQGHETEYMSLCG